MLPIFFSSDNMWLLILIVLVVECRGDDTVGKKNENFIHLYPNNVHIYIKTEPKSFYKFLNYP